VFRIFFLLFFAFIYSTGHAQHVRSFNSITGKKDVNVNCLVQANDATLWLGTSEGLFSFDGKNTKQFTEKEGLRFNSVSALYFDEKGVLWIGHSNGKISTYNNGKIDTFKLNNRLPESRITGILHDENQNLWIATYGSGLFFQKINSDSLQHFTDENLLSDNTIYHMILQKNILWLGTDGGLNRVDLKKFGDKAKAVFINSSSGLPDNIVRKICNAGGNRILIAMQDSGLCYLNTDNNLIEKNPFLSAWTLGAVTDLVSLNQKNIYIATEKNGLIQIMDGRIKIYNSQKGLISSQINQLLFDREHNLWIAGNRGLNLLFSERFTFLNRQSGANDKITATWAEDDHNVWISSDKGFFEVMLNETGEFLFDERISGSTLKENPVSCLAHCPCGNIWIGTYGSGVMNYQIENKKKLKLPDVAGLTHANVSNIIVAKDHHIWIATLGNGIIEFIERPDEPIVKMYTEAEGLGSAYVYQIFCDAKGNIWCANDGAGLQQLVNGKFISITEKFKLSSKTAYSVTEDGLGNIWFVSSDEGVVCYTGKEMIKIGTKDGIRDAQPPVIFSSGNKIALVHSKGVDLIQSLSPLKINQYDVFEGELEPNLNAVSIDNKGYAWIGTNSGLLRFRAFDLPSDTITPKLSFTQLKVQYLPYSIDSLKEFNYNQNNFVFEFKAIWFKQPDNLKYRYRLLGQSEIWTELSALNPISLNNLSHGQYELQIEVCNEEGVWSLPLKYSFSISKPFWLQWWFWLLSVSVLIGGFYAFSQYRLRKLQKEKSILEEKVNIRTAEIVEQAKIIEEKNKELEQLSLVASKTDNVVIIMDSSGKIEYVNDSFIRLNKISLEELKNKFGDTIFDISNNASIHEIVNESIAKKQSVVYESLNEFDDGNKVWESSTLTPIYDESGKLKKLIIIDTDVTERKKQEEVIVQKNKDITDSIQYAKKIQTAILPSLNLVKDNLPDSFILYLTKDIVSGDFYWFANKEDYCLIATVDCTGHGVPGAFMSLIGYNQLNQIVNERDLDDPAQILFELNEGVLNALYRNQANNESKDGMDIAICKVWHNKKKIEFAGAMRPLWYKKYDSEEILEIKADKIPIGTRPEDRNDAISFTTHVIEPHSGDCFYIFSDGYADQFGGDKKKKFTTGKFKKLINDVSGMPMEEQKLHILNAHKQWKGEEEQVDDILVIGFCIA
jgi:PAS domain S-box-containing protein